MPGLVPGIHVLAAKTWMAGTIPAMTKNEMDGGPRAAVFVSGGIDARNSK
jgi:hypothetical protein